MKRIIFGFVVMISTTAPILFAADPATSAPAVVAEPIPFELQTLDNGLRVIYAPMTNAPVVHVRVLYHVGSKDENANRQGFAHMFEHMMFRGSAHVPSERHMKLIQGVGGVSNAFTSFDQTTYVNTVPTTALQMALWLEADRMASFKVSDEVFKTERNVVKEEWRLRVANQPYGTMTEDLFSMAFAKHSYRWLPIGNMDHLAAAQVQELQDFHDHYYVPNNACLVIAGQFDVAQTKQWVKSYFDWIPRAPDIERAAEQEPEQARSREKLVLRKNLPFARVSMAYKSPAYKNDDHLPIELLCTILGGGRSSRLYQALVANDPVAASVTMGNYQLEDPSVIMVGFGVLPGKDSKTCLDRVKTEIAKVISGGVTQDELDKAKTQTRVELVTSRSTAESVATTLAEEETFGGDANRANTYFDRLNKITVDDIKRVAASYLVDNAMSMIEYRPGEPPAELMTPAESKKIAATQEATPAEKKIEAAASHPSDAVATPAVREVKFPSDYPITAPINDGAIAASFKKGETTTVNGVQVITITDNRLPVVNMSLVLRGGSHAVPADKEGVASLAAAMLTRGAAGLTSREIAEDLESHGVSVGASDDGDVTRLSAFGTVDQFDHALSMLMKIALQPDFPADEFTKLKRQSMQGLLGSLSDPGSVADRETDTLVYGNNPLGKNVTQASLDAITLDDVKAYYKATYKPENAILIFSGAITKDDALKAANKLLGGDGDGPWAKGTPPAADYSVATPTERHIVLIDNPSGQQAVVRMAIKSYTLKDEARFAGSIAGQVLSSGIDSRLNKVLRAEKGLTYGAYGYFRPSRNGGAFELSIETKPESVDDAITSAFGVIDKMKAENITDAELAEAKRRVAGSMVLETQTVQAQAGRRVETILNGYPIDYYDHYAERIAQVKADEVRETLSKYFVTDNVNIVVVGPADKVKSQLEKFGTVSVEPMPLADKSATTQPAK